MEYFNNTTFSPDLKVVTATNSLKTNRQKSLGCLIVGGLFGSLLGYMLTDTSKIVGFWGWLTVIALIITMIVIISEFRNTIKDTSNRQRLKKEGITVPATIVGREYRQADEDDEYIIHYQFKPEFVVKYQDDTPERKFFYLPMGSTLPVLHLVDNPEVTGVVTD
jgi:hypothetical protein